MQELKLFESTQTERKPIYIRDLKPINNLKIIFRELRDYFAGNVTGITRDERIAQNIMRILFCKIYDERTSQGLARVANQPKESLETFRRRIDGLFNEVKKAYPDIFEAGEEIEINSSQLSVVISKIEMYSILNADRDVIGDAFEELIGTSFRGGEGQFFTPRNVVQMMIDMLSPKNGERIIDPACGSGGFLAYTLRHLISSNQSNFYIAGIDKDAFLAKIAKIYLSLIGKEDLGIHCENSLDIPTNWHRDTRQDIKLGSFDVVLTNPPFGAKIPVVGKELLGQYKLGHAWQRGDAWQQTAKLLAKQPPQILFIERCLQLLREGGRMGIVLPEGIFGNPSGRYVWEYISSVASVTGVVSLSQETFQPSTHTKTSVLFLTKTTRRPESVFMAIAKNVGHNKNGKPIYKVNSKTNEAILADDLPIITKRYHTNLDAKKTSVDHLGFSLDYDQLSDHIFIPEYYNPEVKKELRKLKRSGKYQLISVGELIDKGILQIRRGNEIGSEYYGTGSIPFVRTTDLVNWEIKFDPVKAVSEEAYSQYKNSQDIKENDILFVNDGTFLIGRTAMITKLDLKILIQSHVRKVRVLDTKALDPYYLFYLLNTKIVRKQIDSKTFVQATISTIGNRLSEVVLPVGKDEKHNKKLAAQVKEIVEAKAKLRQQSIAIVEDSI